MTRPTTLADVAALAGVSGKTVSRVVNRDPNVSTRTKERVEAAIAETRFRPNLAARSLAAARSPFLIGTFAPEQSSSYYAELHRGAARACRRHGYHLVLEEFAHEDGVSAATSFVEIFARDLSHIAYDGLVLPPPICDDAALLDTLDAQGARYVRMAPAFEPGRSPAVFADDATGVAALARHLWASGHRRFGVVVGPFGHGAATARHHDFLDAVHSVGGDSGAVRAVPIAYAGSMIDCGRVAARELLAGPHRPTAIFAFNDEIAAGVMIEARELGIAIPDELAVAGFDDSDVARLTCPPLTTIRQPIREMAEAAVDLLIAPATTRREIRLPVELIVRDSTRTHSSRGDE